MIAAGGYRADTIGEDMELVVRMHRMLRDEKQPYRIDLRARPGLLDRGARGPRHAEEPAHPLAARPGREPAATGGLMFNRRGGAVGWLAFPFMVLFEWLGPLIEVGGYVFMMLAFARR